MFTYKYGDDRELRLMQPYDAEELFALIDANRPYLKEWLPWVDYNTEVKDSQGFIKGALKGFASGEGMTAGIWYMGKLAGLISLMNIDPASRKVEIGYWLGQEYVGHGLMTGACQAMINHAFGPLKLNRVTIRCAVGNSRSRAIPTRLGFREEGCMKDNEWLYDHFVDHIIYGITEKEWQC